jgi:hypothetical protein
MMKGSISTATVLVFVVLLLSCAAQGALVDFYFTLAPNAEQVVGVDVDSDGVGAGWLHLNTTTNTIDWSIVYSNLTGAPTMAHFHGPATPQENAGPQVTLDHTVNPMIGSDVISDTQEAQLMANLWYVNIHTEAYPSGEIRGQITRVIPEPATVALLACGGLFLLRRRRRYM